MKVWIGVIIPMLFLFNFNLNGQVLESDSLALVAIYDSTDGANWTHTWDLSSKVSDWYGVTVKSGRVTELSLINNNLNGKLPGQLGDLTALTWLKIGQSSTLTGPIPEEIGNLKELKTLYFYSCHLNGSLPQSLSGLTNLTELIIHSTDISGAIPRGLDSLKELVTVKLFSNELSGEIPPELGNLPKLESLQLYDNNLSGSIPSSLVNLTSLTQLHLGNNDLTGNIPSNIGNLKNLVLFDASHNKLAGTIPESIGRMDNLETLNLSYNDIGGFIPDSLGDMAALESLNLGDNNLNGEIPESLGNLSQLRIANLYKNQLTGTIPETLGNLSSLTTISLAENELEGTLPESFGKLTQLQYLNLYKNHFSGAVPDTIKRLSSLKNIALYGNRFSSLPDLSGLPSLQRLYVYENQLVFSDLEPQLKSTSLTTFKYSDQDSVGNKIALAFQPGDTLRLVMHVGGEFTHYQWEKDGVVLNAPDDSVLTIPDLSDEDTGVYTCTMSNDSLPDLTLYSRPVTVHVWECAITSDTTWSAGQTMEIGCDLYIGQGVTLTIEPGVRVVFTGPYAITVYGGIRAQGAEEDTIRFTAADTSTGWHGIHFAAGASAEDTSVFSFCRFEYARTRSLGDTLNGTLSFEDSNKVRISHSLFIHNDSYMGGALYCRNINGAVFEHNRFYDNRALHGGALYADAAQLVIANNVFKNNEADFGGAVFCRNKATVESANTYFYGNQARKNGGVFYLSESYLKLINGVLADNSADYGAGLSGTYSQAEVLNSTLADNHAGFYGGALYITFSSNFSVINSILWNNRADSSAHQVYFYKAGNENSFIYSDVEGDSAQFVGTPDNLNYENNINADPLFALSGQEPYQPGENSPCINAGTPDTSEIGTFIAQDILGNQRVINDRIDMGAYEWKSQTAIEVAKGHLPVKTELYANYPNPFNPSTIIAYDLSRAGVVRLRVYNVLGQLIKELVNTRQQAGHYKVEFEAEGLSSGVYFYELKADNFLRVKKMLLVR
ncbi:MAG TPA: T9SS type A sorting domain-containing protein [Caldithrix abyssi]|uniref:T9SS type A sorting domain-containing protein n=1 Tax=Caldithrix abyssi TaxID=187145 RepID=A0A7V4TZX2_CALAY|nr:T9SS type A sorting domain-containing protein [Caldithrix abyssi]